MSSIYLGNDNILRLIGLRNEANFAFVNDATVTASLRSGSFTGSVVSGAENLPMSYSDPGSSTIGGEASGPTVVASASNLDLTVTVGATNALSLAAGTLIEIMHRGTMAGEEAYVWKLASAASGIAGASVALHLMPLVWPDTEDEPTSITALAGEEVLICDGTYHCLLQNTLSLAKGTNYYAEVDANATTEVLQGKFWLKVKGAYRI